MTASVLRCTDVEYHADPLPTPSLSASCAHTLLSRSPYHAWLEHPKLGGADRKHTRAMGTGTLIHAHLLGVTNGELVIVDAANYKTKAAQEARDAALAAGKTPVLFHESAEAEIAAIKIRRRMADKGIAFEGGQAEVKIAWREDDVQCRGAIDYVIGSTIYDLKTIRSADLKTIAKHFGDYGYDVQRAAYVSALTHLHPALEGTVDFVFVFVEVEPPYCVTPVRVDAMRAMLGEMRWARAVRTWDECLRLNHWPDYSDGVVTLSAKPWEIDEEMSR
jgi:hypothetical protein